MITSFRCDYAQNHIGYAEMAALVAAPTNDHRLVLNPTPESSGALQREPGSRLRSWGRPNWTRAGLYARVPACGFCSKLLETAQARASLRVRAMMPFGNCSPCQCKPRLEAKLGRCWALYHSCLSRTSASPTSDVCCERLGCWGRGLVAYKHSL